MVKGWADHSSSDEEEEVVPSTAFVEVDHDRSRSIEQIQVHEVNHIEHETNLVEHSYEYPTEPPYTAFVGNLSYSITDGPMLIDAMTQLVSEQLKVQLNFKSGRLLSDVSSNHTRHRGFGYIECDTVEDLQKLMELNLCSQPLIAGRRINVDTVTSKQRGGGGRSDRRRPSNTSNASSNYNSNNNRRNSSRSVTSTHSDAAVEGPKFRGGRHHNNNSYSSSSTAKQSEPHWSSSNDAPLSASSSQRPVLTLKPRSKPIEGERTSETIGNDSASSALSGSISSIFGAAKPRDEQNWLSHKQANMPKSETDAAHTDNTNHDNGASASTALSSSHHQQQPGRDLRSSGRGSGAGRTGSRGGRGGVDGNTRGSGRAYSGRASSNNATGEQGKQNKTQGSDGAPAAKTVGKKDRKKSTVTAAPVPAAPPSKPIEPEKKAPAKPTNLFSALALDDSDSD